MLKSEEYVTNQNLTKEDLKFHPDSQDKTWFFDLDKMKTAVLKTNMDLYFQFQQHEIWRNDGKVLILDHIPDKNKSGGIGECLGTSYCQITNNNVRKNPHESGSPDFIPFFEDSRYIFDAPTKETYKLGGFDSKGVKLRTMRFMDVKASSHHTQTSSPLVTAWNYFNEVPQIIGVFYTSRLTEEDWKKVSSSKNSNSKLTSNARLLSSGLEKIRMGWLILHNSLKYPHDKKLLIRYNLNLSLKD